MDESKLQPISVLCICSVYYCGEDTEETGERHQVIMLGSTLATGHGHRTRAYGGQWWPGKGGQVDTSCGHTNVNVTSAQTRCLYPVWAEGWHQVRGGHSHYISFFVTSLIFPLFSVTKYISSFSKALQTQLQNIIFPFHSYLMGFHPSNIIILFIMLL